MCANSTLKSSQAVELPFLQLPSKSPFLYSFPCQLPVTYSEIPSMDWDAHGSEPSTPVPGLGALGQACPGPGPHRGSSGFIPPAQSKAGFVLSHPQQDFEPQVRHGMSASSGPAFPLCSSDINVAKRGEKP